MLPFGLSSVYALLGLFTVLSPGVSAQNVDTTSSSKHTKVLILGGGMTGVIAARTLHEHGIEDYIILEAKSELGGRMTHTTFGVPGRQVVVELGANWVQGTQEGNGTSNPIWTLARKHNLKTSLSDYSSLTTYDENGSNNYTDLVNDAADDLTLATIAAGQRLLQGEVDLSFRSAYNILGMTPKTPQEEASQYFQIDWVVAQSPSQTSWLAGSWNNNFTYVPEYGGYSDDNQMCIDQRGYSYIAQAEAAEFLQPQQVIYNQTADLIDYGGDSVTVRTTDGTIYTADHALCTFSVGVLQNNDVVFEPSLPSWKIEAINSIEMGTYTKIFLQFNETFWFPTQFGLYASKHRGEYPVWQSMDVAGFFPGSGVVFVTVTGDWSLYVERLTLDELQSEVMGVLRNMYPDISIPEPVAILRPIWAANPLTRGSYSNWGPSYVPQQSVNLRATLNHHLWFAGEGVSVEHFGFLQGAYLQGQTTGSTMAACIQGNGTCGYPNTTIPMNAVPYQSYLTAPLPSGLSP